MTGETILVVDAGEDIDERMTATLEAEGYLVYPVSSQDVNAELAELLRPSLTYIKPPDLSPTGLKSCKAIHAIPLLKKVPVVILASLKKPLNPDTSKEYGVVDFLEPTFGPGELVEKTRSILGKTAPSGSPREDGPPPPPQSQRRTKKNRPAFLRPAIGIAALLIVAGAGILAFQQFTPARNRLPSSTVAAPVRVPSPAPRAESKPPLPPEKAAPALPVPSTPPPGQPSLRPSEPASQAPRAPFYSVQLGAFKNEDKAHTLASKFREKGYDAFIHLGVAKDNSPIYRVLVSKVEERKAAKKLAGEIQSREEIQTTLYGEQ
jgi:cell division septation protein DedD